MATLAIFLLYREHDRESPRSNESVKLSANYQCINIVEIMDREVDKDYLPNEFPVWECVRQAVDVHLPQKNIF